jgi:hypothetical protein
MLLAAALRHGGQHQLGAAKFAQQLRSICISAAAELHQTPGSLSAAAAAAAPAEADAAHATTKMNLCTAVNSALHVAMAEDPK